MKPIKHHPRVKTALEVDIPGTIQCSSKQEMECLFQEIVSHYNSRVVIKLGYEYTALLWAISGPKSRAARDLKVSHHTISVSKHYGLAGNGKEFFRILLKPVSGYANAAEMRTACIN